MTKAKRIEIVKAMIDNTWACSKIGAENDPEYAKKMMLIAMGMEDALRVFTKDDYAKGMAEIYEISL